MTLKTNIGHIIFSILVLLLLSTIAVADNGSTGTLTVVISDFPNSEGFAMVALSNSKESYEQGADMAIAKRKGKVESAVAQVVFEDVPYGEYAVSLYQDQNANGEMDKNMMGIPKEPYAFSNSVRGKFGKPDWEKVKFELKSAEKKINISFK